MYQSDELQWQQIDEIEARAIPFVDASDYCFYYMNRVSGGFNASYANGRIDDFKKPLDRFSSRPDVLRYKESEITAFAQDLAKLLTGRLAQYCQQYDVALVPINTSRPHDDQFFDDRLVRLCTTAAGIVGNVRVADCMRTRRLIQSAHTGGTRAYQALSENLSFEGFGRRAPDVAILVDDVLTQGVHYAVCRDAIRRAYGRSVFVIGAFLSIHRSDYVDYQSYGITY